MITSPKRGKTPSRGRDVYDKFYSSRKNEESKIYASAILKYLSKQQTSSQGKERDGWVELSDLVNELVITRQQIENNKDNTEQIPKWRSPERKAYNKKMLEKTGKAIPNRSTFFSILDDLVEVGLDNKRLQKKGTRPGRKPTEYRIVEIYPDDYFWSHEGQQLLSDVLLTKLVAAENLLKSHHLNEFDYLPSDEIDKYGKKICAIYDSLISAKTIMEFKNIRDNNPSEYEKLYWWKKS
jgi:hypothetical protein